MEQKILALDLGSNSIGGTIRDLNDKENQFKKTTVITFETGVKKDDKTGKFTLSHAEERTSKRCLRRLYQSRKYKLLETLEFLRKENFCPISEKSFDRWKHYNKEEALKGNGGRAYPVDDLFFNNWIKLDFNNDGLPDYKTPYALREELVTFKLDFTIEENKHKLGRALYHISQHRGFKSSKKVQNADDPKDENDGENYDKLNGAEGTKTKEFWKSITKLNLDISVEFTIGQVFSRIEKYNLQNGTNIRIRKELHQFVTRKMLMQEVEDIFKFQEISFGSIFKNKKGEEIKISQSPMFWQRPLRSQKGTIGKCTLENNKYRCPVSHPAFEEFRAWSFLNNIQYRIKSEKNADWKQIPLDYKQEIYKDKFFRISRKDFDFFEIVNWIKDKNKHDNWQLNYHKKTNVAACPVSARLKDIFGDDWKNYSLKTDKTKQVIKKDGTIKEHKTVYDIDAIWHILFDSDDEDIIEEFATHVLQLGKKVNKFIGLYKSMPVAYSMLSLKAINNILPFLREGLIYSEATLLAKVPKILGNEIWTAKKEVILKKLTKDVIEKNRDEKRILNIVNNLIASYKADPQNPKHNYDYIIGDNDKRLGIESNQTDANQIITAIEDSLGKIIWREKSKEEQGRLLERVSIEYQMFFSDKNRRFKKLPHLQKSMKQFLATEFDFLKCPNTFKELKDGEIKCVCNSCKKLNSLYHPSQIDIYPAAKEGNYKYGDIDKQMVMLGSPKTGAFKNPMAMRALHELRKYINYLIATEQIDEQTRVVVEIPRDSNLEDNNKRWAWNEYQARRRQENKEFREAIYELIKDPQASGSIVNPDSDSDIDKFRIWYEMIQGNDAIEGFEEKKVFVPLEKTIKSKKNRKGEEEDIEEFNENNYLKINKSIFFKLQKAKENVETKYRLWKEQEYCCLYTGRMIGITDLFQENSIDFEHTIPRSKSLDNSLANLTVCDANFNRNIKKNHIPYELDNYSEIKRRLEKWEQKVNDLNLRVDFWKAKSKRATTKEDKNKAIQQRHLWQFELEYWEDKISRFTMEQPPTSGFRKSQLVDTQIISKYAFHYLKTFFNTVEVQKGVITAEFRKIFGVQEIGTEKDRSKHSHHAKDAIVLTLIPTPIVREQMLTLWYEIDEQKQLLKSNTETDKNEIKEEINRLEEILRKLIYQCNLPNVNAVIDKVDEQILINNIAKDNALVAANSRIRSRGKVVPAKDKNGSIIYQTDEKGNPIQRKYKDGNLVWKVNEFGNEILDEFGNKIPVYLVKEKWAKGDSIRGQLHLDTFYGKIKIVEKDERGKFRRDEHKNFIYLVDKKANDFVYKTVLRREVNKEFDVEKIVDQQLKCIIKKQMKGRTIGATIAEDGGIFMLKKDGSKSNKIRHIRCFSDDVTNPVAVKKQTNVGEHKHKNYFWAKNAENSLYGFYYEIGKSERGFECLNLLDLGSFDKEFDTADSRSFFPKTKEVGRGRVKINIPLYTVLKPGVKVIFYKETLEELKELSIKSLYTRLYKMNRIFDSKQGLIQFHYHLDTIDEKRLLKIYPKDEFGDRGKNGFSEVNYDFPYPKLLLSIGKFNFAIEGKHFEIKPDGGIKWL